MTCECFRLLSYSDYAVDKGCDGMTLKAVGWLSKAIEQLSCSAPVEVTSGECKNLVKDKLVEPLGKSFHLVCFQNEKLHQMKAALTAHKDNQLWVISLQSKSSIVQNSSFMRYRQRRNQQSKIRLRNSSNPTATP